MFSFNKRYYTYIIISTLDKIISRISIKSSFFILVAHSSIHVTCNYFKVKLLFFILLLFPTVIPFLKLKYLQVIILMFTTHLYIIQILFILSILQILDLKILP